MLAYEYCCLFHRAISVSWRPYGSPLLDFWKEIRWQCFLSLFLQVPLKEDFPQVCFECSLNFSCAVLCGWNMQSFINVHTKMQVFVYFLLSSCRFFFKTWSRGSSSVVDVFGFCNGNFLLLRERFSARCFKYASCILSSLSSPAANCK